MQQGVSTVLLTHLVLLFCLVPTHHAEQYSSTAKAAAFWKNSNDLPIPSITSETAYGVAHVRVLLGQLHAYKDSNSSLVCGFYCMTSNCTTFLFGIIIAIPDHLGQLRYPQIVLSANRGRPVGENATVEFTMEGNLVLRDFDGTDVWNTSTSGKSVTHMTLLESGNLVLVNAHNTIIWQSFNYPTDTLLSNQTLWEGGKLTANSDITNSVQGPIFLSLNKQGVMQFYFGFNSPISYFSGYDYYNPIIPLIGYKPSNWSSGIQLPEGKSAQFIRLEFSGHLRVYKWILDGWNTTDILPLNFCDYPLACGEYGICSHGQCSCPSDKKTSTTFFRQVDDERPDLGCAPANRLNCIQQYQHKLISLPYNSYSYLSHSNNSYVSSEEGCQIDCLNTCSCKAAFFNYIADYLGNCYMASEIYSISAGESRGSHWSAYIKVQMSSAGGKGAVSITGVVFLLCIACFVFYYNVKNCCTKKMEEEDDIPHFPGMPTRFSMIELKLATGNFSKKLGNGGFWFCF